LFKNVFIGRFRENQKISLKILPIPNFLYEKNCVKLCYAGVPESKSQSDFHSSEISVSNEWRATQYISAGVPEWSNGTGLGPVSLVLTKVRILASAFIIFK
jgi:hypothetical protein